MFYVPSSLLYYSLLLCGTVRDAVSAVACRLALAQTVTVTVFIHRIAPRTVVEP